MLLAKKYLQYTINNKYPSQQQRMVCILYYIMLLQWWKSIFYGAETVIYKRGRFLITTVSVEWTIELILLLLL
jgi:hypothetical protein